MDPLENEWNLVIKVKYGDTLKRFVTFVHGQLLEYDMSKLRDKIICLFKLNPEVVLVLTYTDGDGDVITLENDDELHDAAISQRLNPLRIGVQLKTDQNSDSHSQTAESTRTVLPQPDIIPPQIRSAIDEALEPLPEPFRATVSKLSQDLMLKASSVPALADLVKCFSNVGLTNVGQPSNAPIDRSSGIFSGSSTDLVDLNVRHESKASSDRVLETAPLPSINSDILVPENIPKQNGSDSMIPGPLQDTAPTNVDLNLDPRSNPLASEFPSINDLLNCPWYKDLNIELQKGVNFGSNKNSDITMRPISAPSDQAAEQNQNILVPQSSVSSNTSRGFAEVLGGVMSEQFYGNPIHTPYVNISHSGANINENMGVLPDAPLSYLPRPTQSSRRARSYHDSMLHTFHRNVQCDGCGMHPIMGPRFKSKLKDNYDLCSFCFSEMGNEVDYTRIDRSPSIREIKNPGFRWRSSYAPLVRGMRPAKEKRGKLESCFVQDVTVADGTFMPPSTPFTKIWRMHNNGSFAWPSGVQLVWIGGVSFGNHGPIALEIPAIGCPVNGEIDIAVDFISPAAPGKYISYWKMASPSGQKFGQRVWAYIEVENRLPKSTAGSSHANLNLNLPPESTGGNGLEVTGMNVEPLEFSCSKPNVVGSGPHSSVNTIPIMNIEPPAPAAKESSLEANIVAQRMPEWTPVLTPTTQTMPEAGPSVLNPFTDLSSSSNPSPAADTPGATISNPVELTLLKELEEMGFKQIDLNKEVLRQNEYDLEQSVDDLCGYAEWDPLLVELNEMGFDNKELNKKLLVKNGGSIKRTVLDLIGGKNE